VEWLLFNDEIRQRLIEIENDSICSGLDAYMNDCGTSDHGLAYVVRNVFVLFDDKLITSIDSIVWYVDYEACGSGEQVYGCVVYRAMPDADLGRLRDALISGGVTFVVRDNYRQYMDVLEDAPAWSIIRDIVFYDACLVGEEGGIALCDG